MSSLGAQDDLQKVTKMAYEQIRLMGMNDKIGLVSYPTGDSNFGGKPYSKQTARMIDDVMIYLIFKQKQTGLQRSDCNCLFFNCIISKALITVSQF